MEYCGFRKETNGAREGADTLIRWLKERGYTLVIATTKQSNMEVHRTRNARMMEKARIDTRSKAGSWSGAPICKQKRTCI